MELLKSLTIAAYWSHNRRKTFEDCVPLLSQTFDELASLQGNQGEWRIMRDGPIQLGIVLEGGVEETSLLLEGKLPGSIAYDPDERKFMGYGVVAEYLGPVPLILKANVALTSEDVRFQNSVLVKFQRGTGVGKYHLDQDFVEKVFETIVRIWDPQTARCSVSEILDASPYRRERNFPLLGWLNYFGEPEVVRLVGDLGTPFANGVLIKVADRPEDVTAEQIVSLAEVMKERDIASVLHYEL